MAFVIDIEQLGRPAWVQYKEDFYVKIRPLSSKKRAQLEKECTIERVEIVRGQKVVSKELDTDKLEEAIREWIIEDWYGPKAPDGKPVACTKEAKLAVLDHYHNLRAFCLNYATDLHALDEMRKKELEKNFVKTSK